MKLASHIKGANGQIEVHGRGAMMPIFYTELDVHGGSRRDSGRQCECND